MAPDASVTASGGAPTDEEAGYRDRLFEMAIDMLCVAGFDGYFKELNPAFEQTLGHTREELLARPFLDFVHPEDLESTVAEVERISEGATTISFDNRYRCRDGSYRWLRWTAAPTTESGLIFAVARDVTEQKETEGSLRRSEAKVRSLLESAPDAMVISDARGRIVSVNRKAELLFGYTKEEFARLRIESLVPEGLREVHQGHRRAWLEDRQARPMGAGLELVALLKDGSELPVDVGIAPIESEEGLLVVATVTDVSARRRVEAELREANAALEARISELQSMGREAELLSQMSEMLQSCLSPAEAYRVVDLYAKRLFDPDPGSVWLVAPSRNMVERVSAWGNGDMGPEVFAPTGCWALRRGRLHVVPDPAAEIACEHLPEGTGSICVPMLAQGEQLGILSLQAADGVEGVGASRQRLAVTFAENVALALANLALRDRLRAQSIRDPLTGLYNRRHMEESFERELSRAARKGSHVAVMMLDLDHFKSFNDEFGHEAGDALLVETARILRSSSRGEDIACRYGGEEFVLVFPDTTLSSAAARADQIREAVRELRSRVNGRDLGAVTISIGVSVFPEHGAEPAALLREADGALYRAKSGGRDRVEIATNDTRPQPEGEVGAPTPGAAPERRAS